MYEAYNVPPVPQLD